ncbi:hypothetical protein Plhal703r1_c52g0157881 [Plasmopara halstedii]
MIFAHYCRQQPQVCSRGGQGNGKISAARSCYQQILCETFRRKQYRNRQNGPLNAASEIIPASSELQNKLVLYIPLSKTFPAIFSFRKMLKIVYLDLPQRNEFQGFTHIFLFIVSNDYYDISLFNPTKLMIAKKRKTKVDIDVTQYVGEIFLALNQRFKNYFGPRLRLKRTRNIRARYNPVSRSCTDV